MEKIPSTANSGEEETAGINETISTAIDFTRFKEIVGPSKIIELSEFNGSDESASVDFLLLLLLDSENDNDVASNSSTNRTSTEMTELDFDDVSDDGANGHLSTFSIGDIVDMNKLETEVRTLQFFHS